MNLGGAFAGGLTQGMQSRQAMEERKASNEHSRNLQNRQMGMREVEFGNQQADRASAEAREKLIAGIAGKYYGEHEVEDGEAFDDDGMGNITRIPIKKKVNFVPHMPGQEARDAQFMGEMMRLSMTSGKFSVAEFKGTAEAVEKGRQTELGRSLEGVLRGDKAAMAKFLTSVNKNPEGAKLNIDVSKGLFKIILADGEVFDLEEAMISSSKADIYWAAKKSASEDALRQSQIRENDAQTTLSIPAAAAASRATANARNEDAAYTRTAKTNLTNERAEAAGNKGIKIPSKAIDEAIYDPGARAAVTVYAQGLARNGKTPDVAALEAVAEYQQELAKFKGDKNKVAAAKSKGLTPEQAVARAMK